MPSRKPTVKPPKNLHVAAVQRIVGLHNNHRLMTLDSVRLEIERLAKYAGTQAESKDRARLREHLESATGLSITNLAELTKHWPT